MPEGVGYSGSNVVAGTGLSINYVGDHVYAYSGDIASSGSEGTPEALLDFTTGARSIVCTIQFSYSLSAVQRGVNSIEFNGLIVAKQFFRTASATYENTWPMTFELFIPPYTAVRCLNGFEDSAGNQCVTLIGKTYK